jgi:hypothetical protein
MAWALAGEGYWLENGSGCDALYPFFMSEVAATIKETRTKATSPGQSQMSPPVHTIPHNTRTKQEEEVFWIYENFLLL